MFKTYQFSGIKRQQFPYLLLLSLLIGFSVGTAVLYLLVQYLIFHLGLNGDTTPWLMPVIFGAFFVCSVTVAFVMIKWLTRFMKTTWMIQLTTFDITIQSVGKKTEVLSFSQLKKINFMRVKTLMGFNQSIQLIFDSKNIDFQVVISPIVASSTEQDKVQFFLFINELYSELVEKQFELEDKNKIVTEILQLLVDEALIEHKVIFIKKT